MPSFHFFGTQTTYLAETLDYRARSENAGAVIPQLSLIDQHIRAYKAQNAFDSLEQWCDARYGVVFLPNTQQAARLLSVKGQDVYYSTTGNGAADTGVPWLAAGAQGLSSAVLDNTGSPLAAQAGSVAALAYDADYTWCVRMRLSNAADSSPFFGNRYGGGNASSAWVNLSREAQYVNDPANGGANNSITGYTLPVSQWRFFWLVKAGTLLRLYVDSTLLGESAITTNMPTIPFYVGGDAFSGASSLPNNAIYYQSVRRWRSALSPEQRTALQF